MIPYSFCFWRMCQSLAWFPPIHWWRKRRIGKFTKFMFPIIKGLDWKNMPSAKDFVTIQPMNKPVPAHLTFHLEFYDIHNPQKGQVFEIGLKHPLTHKPSCSCIRNSDDYWHKLWTGDHWIYEQNMTKKEWLYLIQHYFARN